MNLSNQQELRWRIAFMPHPLLLACPEALYCDPNDGTTVVSALKQVGYEIPDDVEIVNLGHDPIWMRYNVVLEHPSFDDLMPGLPKLENGDVDVFRVPFNWIPDHTKPARLKCLWKLDKGEKEDA